MRPKINAKRNPFYDNALCLKSKPTVSVKPEQLRGSWSAAPEGQRAKACLDAGRDAMDQEKMSQLMLYTWLGAGGVDGLLWRHICSTDGLTRCDSSSEQAMAVIKFAMPYAQLCGNHSSLAVTVVTQDKFLMLKAWHASVPTLTVSSTSVQQTSFQRCMTLMALDIQP